MKLARLVEIGFVCALLCEPVHAQSTDEVLSSKVDLAVRARMAEMHIPGTSLAVVRDGKIIKATGYGLANVELNVPVTPVSIFQTGSLGKHLTATAVMLLVEEGKVRLDDSITKYFPEAQPAWNKVTIRNLLTHTSGIPDVWGQTEEDAYTKGIVDARKDYDEEQLTRIYLALKLEFQPGEKWSYCNTGYALLGFLIHRVTGIYYGDFLQQRVFGPLGMNATTIISEADIVPNRVSGYVLAKGKLKNQDWIAPFLNTTAEGGLYSNVLDLARWDAALYIGTILPRSRLEEMWTPVKLNSGKEYPYGLGWFLADVKGHRLLYHTGGNQGFFISMSRYVDDRLTIIVLNNMDEYHCDTLAIAGDVASIYIPETKGANPIKDW
jgi:CubicO group peptidase (beta-lactamase class C family)